MRYEAIIEISKGSKKKSEIKTTGEHRVLNKVKRGFISNYGKMPGTLAGDGDCGDVFVLGRKLKTGKKLDVAPYALIEFIDRGVEDNKVIAYSGKLTYLKRKQCQRLAKLLQKKEGFIKQKGQKAAKNYIKRINIKNL